MYALRIKNKLTTGIAYCYHTEDKGCPHIIHSGDSDEEYYISKGGKSSAEEIYNIFDKQNIIICKKAISLKRIRSVSPIVKRDKYDFEIIIDETVSDAFCQ
jgi:hypothetical protein